MHGLGGKSSGRPAWAACSSIGQAVTILDRRRFASMVMDSTINFRMDRAGLESRGDKFCFAVRNMQSVLCLRPRWRRYAFCVILFITL